MLVSILQFTFINIEDNMKGIIITGAESTGSVFISKAISQSFRFNDWNGHGFYEPNNQFKFLHRSQPYGKNNYSNYRELSSLFQNFECKYILCTRDISCSNSSTQRRFSRTDSDLKHNYNICKKIMSEIISSGEPYFIWSYETMIYFGKMYFDLLYDFLQIKNSDRYYPEVINKNIQYFK